ncbi:MULTISPECIES: TerD family protein [Chryseobacterium]|uniref:Tellurium resistance protein TerD n=1 Tax=Chryseobacterium camelliae TaxID=1265445 RepID=A0ABU0TDI0_9FLAO|nr:MULTISPECIES: TerD family protein [Chryseobacterium]MDT3407208.1 tellurium resistance protein TerD [Pseudacidovorax intermedius]MDQ1095001.1 tellurium resistance protein TerD [Chryseobacterium camelliae]MDQ1098941.1 tellurium resistance protein TerD [Chryseobacterium sp. SORGH_AS_1048]MDR6086289.1 tellurium resistance protein TerD [Chryseobacterium sp. SORGH_AS_0909]MDR6130661.1 tellurium resistance protein TerD [Chryseobacterium sp. SORGH_AS_1175]
MAINLQKGQRENINAPKFTVGLGWDTNNTSTGGAFDLDASLFLLGENKKLISDNHFIFYNNLESPDKSVIHSGDNLTGDGDGDDEQIKIDLTKIDPAVKEITVVVTIHEADARRQNFGQVRNSFIRIFNTDTNEEILKYELDEDFSIETAVEFGRIYNRNGEWKFEAVGTGQREGLEKFVSIYQ